MNKPIHVAILGASGYGAGELLRLFVPHPQAAVVAVTSTSQVGRAIADVHPHLRGFYPDLNIGAEIDFARLLDAEQAVVFSALPHGASGEAIDKLLERPEAPRLKIVDLSGDLRLKDEADHTTAYPHSPWLPQRRSEFVYGLPELNRATVRTAQRIANPGCLALASILAAAPAVRAGFCGLVAIDAKTGSSGAGRALKEATHHPTRHADFRAYKPLVHQHEPEIVQALQYWSSKPVQLSFVPHSMAVSRGIFVTLHAACDEPTDADALQTLYERFYADSPFVRIVPESPSLKDVVGSNFCDIAVAAREQQIVVMAAIDNLVKGMAGTAIQNMNLLCGLPETAGLWTPALRPV